MKQLLIVDKAKALNANTGTAVTPYNLSGLAKGAISFFELGASSLLSAAPTKNFAIALGRGNNSPAFVIPEVDIDTLQITKALPVLGKAFSRKFTFPTPVKGKDYSIMFIKCATVPHERNTWTCTVTASGTTASTEATAMKTAIEAKLGDKFTVSVNSAAVTITAKTVGEQWEAKFADELTGTSWAGSTDYVNAEPTIGDKAYIQHLASMCAAGKGFTDTYRDGDTIYPGYPEVVEDLTPNTSGDNGASTSGYAVFTLRFQVGRDAAKTRDEKVWQVVHIAVPVDSGSAYAAISSILPEGNFKDAKTAAIAAEVVEEMVNSSDLNGSE